MVPNEAKSCCIFLHPKNNFHLRICININISTILLPAHDPANRPCSILFNFNGSYLPYRLFIISYGGWYVDKTGHLRELHVVVNLFSIVGNFIYSVSYSKWFPVIGRLLSGLADGAQPGLGGK